MEETGIEILDPGMDAAQVAAVGVCCRSNQATFRSEPTPPQG